MSFVSPLVMISIFFFLQAPSFFVLSRSPLSALQLPIVSVSPPTSTPRCSASPAGSWLHIPDHPWPRLHGPYLNSLAPDHLSLAAIASALGFLLKVDHVATVAKNQHHVASPSPSPCSTSPIEPWYHAAPPMVTSPKLKPTSGSTMCQNGLPRHQSVMSSSPRLEGTGSPKSWKNIPLENGSIPISIRTKY